MTSPPVSKEDLMEDRAGVCCRRWISAGTSPVVGILIIVVFGRRLYMA
jgi:hypothetical protein